MQNKKLLTVKEAAEYLNVTSAWLYQVVSGVASAKGLKYIRLGDKPNGSIRFRQSDLDEYLDSKSTTVDY